MSEERAERCETCRFWDCWDEHEPAKVSIREFHARMGMPLEDSKVPVILEILGKVDSDTWPNPDFRGTCRRNPPCCLAVEDNQDPCTGQWPFTEGHDWCGEWQPNGPDLRHE